MGTVKSSETYYNIWTGSEYEKLCTTDHDFNMSIESDDVTDMCSDGWKESVSEIRSIAATANGVFESTDTVYAALKAAFFSTASGWGQILAQFVSADGDTYGGTLQINSIGEASAYNQEVRFSLDASFTGTVATV
jgi:predicted secreted protein